MSKNNISIASETIKTLEIRTNFLNFDLAITNSMFTTLLVCLSLTTVGLLIGLTLPKQGNRKVNSFQTFIEIIGESLASLIKGISGSTKISNRLFTLVGFFFIFIVISSWVGLLPGVGQLQINHNFEEVHLFRAPTTDLNATIALSTIAFILIQIQGFSSLKFGYLQKFLNFKDPMKFFVGILEFISEISRLFSFSLRLFGNIFAGEVMLGIVGTMSLGVVSGVPFGLPFPSLIIALEFLVAIIQAYVFVALFLVFSNLAKEEAH
jgi:F-type H+-transporting ATPase subunit a